MGTRFACALLVLLLGSVAWADGRINAVIGDASWTTGSPHNADEQTRIRTHLGYVLDLLRERDVSGVRATSLDALERYIARGKFPRRTGDDYLGRRPRFIDDRGVHCAVGQLIADSGAPELARAIDEEYEYAYVRDMRSPALTAWADTHGFTIDELAMIQPSYSGAPTADGTKREILAHKDQITIACAREGAPLATIAFRVTGHERGHATATTESQGPFAACFTKRLNAVERGGGAYDRSPRPYAFDISLQLTSPQKLFEQLLDKLELPPCTPRPGNIPREVVIDARTSKEGLVIEIATVPSNSEVDACLKDELTTRLQNFGAGVWDLRAKRTRKAATRVFHEQVVSYLQGYGERHAVECYPKENAPQKLTITGTAKPDDPEFTLQVGGGDATFTSCVRDKVQASLRDSFSVHRKGEKYFRIDAAVKATVTVLVRSPAKVEEEQKEREQQRKRRKY